MAEPKLPEHVGHVHSAGEFCWDRNVAPLSWPVNLYTAEQMHAHAERARADVLEQAAKVCDTVATRVPDGAISPYDAAKYVVAKDCAAAIRALIPAKDAE